MNPKLPKICGAILVAISTIGIAMVIWTAIALNWSIWGSLGFLVSLGCGIWLLARDWRGNK